MNPDVPCRVSADELAHDRAQEQRPFWTCNRCREELFEEDAEAQNWLVCKGCGKAACESCIIELASSRPRDYFYRSGDERLTSLESVYNLGFCSPGCLAAAYERDGWEYRKGRLMRHASDSESRRVVYLERFKAANDPIGYIGACSALLTEMASLVGNIRAVCNLERK